MTKKFKNKYRSESVRLKGWDYGRDAGYFVTICTKNREHYFGKVIDGKMNLTEIGKIAASCWYEIPDHFPFVILDAFVVMPNHIHGIIIINKNNYIPTPVDKQNFEHPQSPHSSENTETQNFTSQPPEVYKNKFGPQSKNLASIVRGYKVGVKKYATINEIDFVWQPKYHDHIIRNDQSFKRIATYIQNNPAKWSEDKFYKQT